MVGEEKKVKLCGFGSGSVRSEEMREGYQGEGLVSGEKILSQGAAALVFFLAEGK